MHLLSQTTGDWYRKRQATVVTATFGSDFTAARIAVDQILDLKTLLRNLGAPVHTKSFMFGDNQAVVTSSTKTHSSLNKRYNALSYHRVSSKGLGGIIGLMEGRTQLMFLANIGDIRKYGIY
jgi:hypothetical protein